MSDNQGTTWPSGGRGSKPANRCTRCGTTPVIGRGLCGYHYAKLRTHLHAVGAFESLWVDITPARDRVKALRAAGVGLPRLEQLTGIPLMTLFRLSDPNRMYTERHVVDAVLEVDVPTMRVDPVLAAGARVPVIPSQRRIRALAVLGYSQDHLLERLGIKTGTCALNKIYAAAYPHVTAKRHREIAALFDELVWIPGPSPRATRDAVRKGWHGPWSWDDIDDPDCVPDTVRARMERRRADARRERNRWLDETLADHRSIGRVRDDADAAALLGIRRDSLERREQRDRARNGGDEVAS